MIKIQLKPKHYKVELFLNNHFQKRIDQAEPMLTLPDVAQRLSTRLTLLSAKLRLSTGVGTQNLDTTQSALTFTVIIAIALPGSAGPAITTVI